MADYTLDDLNAVADINADDILHLRNASGLDKKITKTNLIKSLRFYKGMNSVSLSNYDNDAAPVVKNGSVFENNGIIIDITSDQSPTGYSGINDGAVFYIKWDESASTFVFTQTPPTWSDTNQGWYDGSDRYLFSMSKLYAGYAYKELMKNNNNRQLQRIFSIGSFWDYAGTMELNYFRGVTYGNGIFVGVSSDGTNRIAVSSDGVKWTALAAPEANQWYSITFGNGLFVAVSITGTHRIMTSNDGFTWSLVTAPEANQWYSVTFGNGLFVAVSRSGTHRVMTSPDGVTWTSRTHAGTGYYKAVTYGNGIFVAVADAGDTNRAMTSSDGINWTSHEIYSVNYAWHHITYGGGLFVCSSDSDKRIAYSSDGDSWSFGNGPGTPDYQGIAYGAGRFVVVYTNGSSDSVLISDDAKYWTVADDKNPNLYSVCYSEEKGIFVALGRSTSAYVSGS